MSKKNLPLISKKREAAEATTDYFHRLIEPLDPKEVIANANHLLRPHFRSSMLNVMNETVPATGEIVKELVDAAIRVRALSDRLEGELTVQNVKDLLRKENFANIGLIDAQFRCRIPPFANALFAIAVELFSIELCDTLICEIGQFLKPTSEDFRITEISDVVQDVIGYSEKELYDQNCNVFQLLTCREYNYDPTTLNGREVPIADLNGPQLQHFVKFLDPQKYPKCSLADSFKEFSPKSLRVLPVSQESSLSGEDEFPIFSALNFTKSENFCGFQEGGDVFLVSMLLFKYRSQDLFGQEQRRCLALQSYVDLADFPEIPDLKQIIKKIDDNRKGKLFI